MEEFVIEMKGLTKVFPGDVVAVNALDMAIPRGTVYGFIGRNGAGKTTALRLLMGLLRPSAGRTEILGQELISAPREHRARVAYVSQEQQIHAWMTLAELCAYVGHFYPTWDQSYAERLAGRFGVAMDRQTGLLSGGERRKAAILLALAARPDVLVMDEPAAGLDPIARRELIDALVETLNEGNGRTVLFSTHIISDLERVADHVGIMDKGRLVTSSPLADLQTSTKRVQMIFPGDRVPEGFALPGAIRSETSGPVYTAVVRQADESALAAAGAGHGARVQVFSLGLEDIFIEVFGKDAKNELM
ncbi:MAG: ABC transporter ATP-binding protein [Planctomycetota bacterium]